MKRRVWIVLAGTVATMLTAYPAYCCSPIELVQKQKAFAAATKEAFDRDPGGDAARQEKVRTVIERYKDVKNSSNGSYIIDMICKENDELLAIYK